VTAYRTEFAAAREYAVNGGSIPSAVASKEEKKMVDPAGAAGAAGAVELAPVVNAPDSGSQEGHQPGAAPLMNVSRMDSKHGDSSQTQTKAQGLLPPAQAAARVANNATPPIVSARPSIERPVWASPPSSAASQCEEGKIHISGAAAAASAVAPVAVDAKAISDRLASVRSNSGSVGSLSISHDSPDCKCLGGNTWMDGDWFITFICCLQIKLCLVTVTHLKT
jgi:hypothetical protein